MNYSREEAAFLTLKTKCEQVQNTSESEVIVNLLDAVIEESQHQGISAPEINVMKNVAVIRLPNFSLNLINPEILSVEDKIISYNETCSAFDSFKINCLRHKTITIQNGFNKEIITLSGKPSILAQHLIDHFNGKIHLERMIKCAIVRDDGLILDEDKCPCASKKKFKECCKAFTKK
jgi:peptide deformylase